MNAAKIEAPIPVAPIQRGFAASETVPDAPETETEPGSRVAVGGELVPATAAGGGFWRGGAATGCLAAAAIGCGADVSSAVAVRRRRRRSTSIRSNDNRAGESPGCL